MSPGVVIGSGCGICEAVASIGVADPHGEVRAPGWSGVWALIAGMSAN